MPAGSHAWESLLRGSGAHCPHLRCLQEREIQGWMADRDNSIPRSVSFSRHCGTSRIFPIAVSWDAGNVGDPHLPCGRSSPSLHSPWVTSGGGRGQAGSTLWPRCRHKKPLLAGFNPLIFRPPSEPEPQMTDFTLGAHFREAFSPHIEVRSHQHFSFQLAKQQWQREQSVAGRSSKGSHPAGAFRMGRIHLKPNIPSPNIDQ